MTCDQIVLREASPVEESRWDELITRFDNRRVTHTLSWIRSLENCGKGRPLFLVYESGGEVVGYLPGLLTRVGPIRVFGSPMPGWQTVSMGPVFDNAKITTTEMLPPLIRFLEHQYGVHHIEMISHDLDHGSMQSLGFHGEPLPTYRGDLFPRDQERVMRAMKDSARRNVKRGLKLGLITKFNDDEAFVDEAYDQICEVFARGGNAVPFRKHRSLEFFREMKRAGTLIAVGVYLPDSEKCIATGLFTADKRELLLWMWTHRAHYRWYRPTELMTWSVMQRAMELGCESFDLMGRGDFKAKFGAYMDTTKYRWVRSRYKWITEARDLTEKCYRWQQSLRGALARRRFNNHNPESGKYPQTPVPEKIATAGPTDYSTCGKLGPIVLGKTLSVQGKGHE